MIISFAWISNGCLASGVSTKVPITFIDELIGNFEISLKFSNLLSKTTWMFLKKDPSFTSINPKALEALRVLIQPEIATSLDNNLLLIKCLIF